MASYMMQPSLLAPAQSMMPPASAFPPAPEAPAASASPVPQATGGLGGLGGLMRDPMFGDTLNALFTSIATSPRNNMLANFGALQNNAIDRRRLMTADAQKTQQNALETEAMKQALKAAGFSDAEAEQMAVNPQAAQVMLDQRKAQAAAQARREFMAQMPSLDGGDSASRVPQMQMVPQTGVASGGQTPANGVDGLLRMRGQLTNYLQNAPDEQSFNRGKLYLEQVDKRLETMAPTDDVREYEYAVRQGYQGTLPQFMTEMRKAGATSVTVGGEGAPGLGKLSPDYGYVLDPQTRQPVIDPNTGLPRAAAVPGSPAWAAEQAASDKANLRNNQQQTTSDTVLGAAGKARKIASQGWFTTGTPGRIASNVLSESDAAELRRQVSALKAVAASENINAMRQASPTGGALGNASDADIKLLQDKAGAIDPNASREDFLRALDDYERTLLRIVHGKDAGDVLFNSTRQGGDGWQDLGNGVRIRKVN